MICISQNTKERKLRAEAYLPSPHEIRRRAAEVRRRWTYRQRRRRIVMADTFVEIMVVHVADQQERWTPSGA